MRRRRNDSVPGSPTGLSFENTLYKLKVVLIGDISVGKTSMAVRFTSNKFEDAYKQTIGASFISKIAHVNGDVISFQIWDTAGQERYKSLVPMYLRNAHIALVLFDLTEPSTFDNANIWLDALRQHGDLVKTILVGNKCDLEPEIDDEVIEGFANDNGIQFAKTSAKSGYNVDDIFHMMGSMVVNEMKFAEKEEMEKLHTIKKQILKEEVVILSGKDSGHDKKRSSSCCHRKKHRV